MPEPPEIEPRGRSARLQTRRASRAAPEREERRRAFEAQAEALLALDADRYLEAIGAAMPETIPAEVLVLCIRHLRGKRPEEAQRTLERLILAQGTYPHLRYPYLDRLRRAAEHLVPKGQQRQTAEDLFQAAVALIIEQIHTNESAVTAWPSFCAGRLRDARRAEWGRKLAHLGRETAASLVQSENAQETRRDPLEVDAAEGLFADGNGDGFEEWLLEVQRRAYEGLGELEREVLDDLWFAPREPTPITELAKRLDVPRDRIYNIRRDAWQRVLEAVRTERHGRFDPELIAALIERLPARRGSKPKRRPPSV